MDRNKWLIKWPILIKSIRFKTSILRSDSCDFSDAYIVVKETITVEGENDAKTRNKRLIFKYNSSFRSCISKIYNKFIENVEDLVIVLPMHNLLEYSNTYSMTSESFCIEMK